MTAAKIETNGDNKMHIEWTVKKVYLWISLTTATLILLGLIVGGIITPYIYANKINQNEVQVNKINDHLVSLDKLNEKQNDQIKNIQQVLENDKELKQEIKGLREDLTNFRIELFQNYELKRKVR